MDKLTRPFSSQMRALKSRSSSELMLDMLFAAAVPMIISGVAMEWGRIHPRIFSFFTNWARWGWRPKFVRTIEYEKHVMSHFGSQSDGTDECQRNNILHRAILLYMGQELDLRYSQAQVLLSAMKEKATIDTSDARYPHLSKKVYGGTAEQLRAYSVSITPPKRDWVPLGDDVFFCQHTTTESDDQRNPGSRGITKKTVTFTFASSKSDGDLRIQAFLNKAFLWYCKAMESTEDHFRYYYTPLTEPAGGAKALPLSEHGESSRAVAVFGGAGGGGMGNSPGARGQQKYKRYRLGNEKAFDTLFFPEKELLLKILDNFQHKTGKYGIKGYPHKLGLLLHGPPGTGKSSLIKALALHTERHVIDVPLARIKTNQDLMDIMFDQSFPVDKQDLPITLAVENVIFVMEDVDATSPIVRSRDLAGSDTYKPAQPQEKQTSAKKARHATPPFSQPDALRQPGIADRGAAVQAGATGKEEPTAVTAKTIDVSAAATSTTTTTGLIAAPIASPTANQSASAAVRGLGLATPEDGPGLAKAGVADGAGMEGNSSKGGKADKNNNNNNDEAPGGKTEERKGRTPDTPSVSAVEIALLRLTSEAASKKKEEAQKEKERSSMTDKLDLAGLLNVLDGVVDSPGRIVIMTTNFPDALDAALIRPGRVDKKIHLGYMKYAAAKDMTRHFFEVDQLTLAQDQRLRSVFDEDRASHSNGGGGSMQEAGDGAGRKITPAVVEQLAGEFDYVDEFIGALEAL